MGRKQAQQQQQQPPAKAAKGARPSDAASSASTAATNAGSTGADGPSGAEIAAAIYRAEENAKQSAGAGRSVRARHMLGVISHVFRHALALSLALALAGLACLLFPPPQLLSSSTSSGSYSATPPANPLAELPPLPVIADVPYIATFLVASFDDAIEDIVKAICLYATFSSGRLLVSTQALPATT